MIPSPGEGAIWCEVDTMTLLGRMKWALASFVEKLNEDIEKDTGRYWELSTSDERVQDQSHWCGSRRWDRRRWFEYGDFHYHLIEHYLTRHAGPQYLESLGEKDALEWGCGGGANIRPMCRHFRSVYGVDVSHATLDNCERQIKGLNLHNFVPVYFLSENPESVLTVVESDTIDLVLSVAVFQHFPSKDYSSRVLKVMRQLMKKGGFALLQIRYFDGSDKLSQKDRDYARNVVYMTSFTTEEFSNCVADAGLTLLCSCRDIDNTGDRHEYFFATK